MGANFTNCSRGEYSQATADTAVGAAHRRVVYASWHPDQFKLAVTWVREFKDRIAAFDCDEANAPLTSKVFDEPGEAGTVRASGREAIASALGDVTDFIVVATGSYFAAQKNQGESELGWMIESSSAGARHVIWVAALEGKLSFKGRKAGDRDLSVFSGWHPTRSDSDPLDVYSFPERDDLATAQKFAVELNAAVERLLKHCPVCPICSHAKRL